MLALFNELARLDERSSLIERVVGPWDPQQLFSSSVFVGLQTPTPKFKLLFPVLQQNSNSSDYSLP